MATPPRPNRSASVGEALIRLLRALLRWLLSLLGGGTPGGSAAGGGPAGAGSTVDGGAAGAGPEAEGGPVAGGEMAESSSDQPRPDAPLPAVSEASTKVGTMREEDKWDEQGSAEPSPEPPAPTIDPPWEPPADATTPSIPEAGGWAPAEPLPPATDQPDSGLGPELGDPPPPAPAETSAETPVQTTAETPTGTQPSADEPVIGTQEPEPSTGTQEPGPSTGTAEPTLPAETPSETQAETSTEAQTETPSETSTETPAETPSETPTATLVEPPAQPAGETQAPAAGQPGGQPEPEPSDPPRPAPEAPPQPTHPTENPMSETTQATQTAAGTGTLRVFKRLKRETFVAVHHGFGSMPLVDVYELERFLAATSADLMQSVSEIQFYVYHRTDAQATVRMDDGTRKTVDVEPGDHREGEGLRIPFERALQLANVSYDDDTTLGDVVTDFWSSFFDDPNDQFEETDFGNSPWLDRNVGDRRTVGQLKNGGDWDDLFLQFRPQKTINWPPATLTYTLPVSVATQTQEIKVDLAGADAAREQAVVSATGQPLAGGPLGLPPGVEVIQIGLDTVGLSLRGGGPEEVNVMVLLRP